MAVHTNAADLLLAPGAIEASEPTALGLNAGGWVALAMIVVIGILLWKGGARAIGRSLDRKIAGIRDQLEEAARLRRDAEALLAEYQARQAAAQGEADAILRHARAEADAIVAKAQQDTEALVVRRARMAQDRIDAAERAAIAAVRAQAAGAAVAAATHILADRLDGAADRELVDRTIATLGQRPN